jgi:hypothetical protein
MQQKLMLKKGLPFSNIVHKVLTLDAQPASSSIAAIMVLVTGQLLVDEGQNVLQYSQMFHVSQGFCVHHCRIFKDSELMLIIQLVPEGQGYFVQNDVFRL